MSEFKVPNVSPHLSEIGAPGRESELKSLNNEQRAVGRKTATVTNISGNSQTAIWTVDKDFSLTQFNKAFIEFWNLLRTDPAGAAHLIALPTEAELKSRLYRWHLAFLKGESYSEQLSIETDDELFIYQLECVPIVQYGEIIGGTFFAVDTSKVHAQEKILQARGDELKRINSHLDKLIYSASHDLRSPVTSAKGLLHLMRIDSKRDYFSKYSLLLEKSLDKLDLIIQAITTFANTAKSDVQHEHINVESLIHESLLTLENLDGFSDVTIKIQTLGVRTVCTDRYLMRTVLSNLLNNAIRFRDKTKIDKIVRIKTSFDKKKCRIDITDNGIGISKEQHERIFEMFYKASETNSGPGLGLFIVKEALNKLGGSIRVYSELGVGTKFIVELDRRFVENR